MRGDVLRTDQSFNVGSRASVGAGNEKSAWFPVKEILNNGCVVYLAVQYLQG